MRTGPSNGKSGTKKRHNHSHNNYLNDNLTDSSASTVDDDTRRVTNTDTIQDPPILDKINQLTDLSSKASTETTNHTRTDHLPNIDDENSPVEDASLSSKTDQEENAPQVNNQVTINDSVNASTDEEKSDSLNSMLESFKMHQKILGVSRLIDTHFQLPRKDYGIFIDAQLGQLSKSYLGQPISNQELGRLVTEAKIRRFRQISTFCYLLQFIFILRAKYAPRTVPATPTSGGSCRGGKGREQEEGSQGGGQESGEDRQEGRSGSGASAGAGGSGGGDDRRNNERKVNRSGEKDSKDEDEKDEEEKRDEGNSEEQKDSGLGSLGDTQKTEVVTETWVKEMTVESDFKEEKTQFVCECTSPLCPREELQKLEVVVTPRPSPPTKMHPLKPFSHQQADQPILEQSPCTQDNSTVGSSPSPPPSTGSDSAISADAENDVLVTGRMVVHTTPSSSSSHVEQEVGPENIQNNPIPFPGHAGSDDSSTSSSDNSESSNHEYLDHAGPNDSENEQGSGE